MKRSLKFAGCAAALLMSGGGLAGSQAAPPDQAVAAAPQVSDKVRRQIAINPDEFLRARVMDLYRYNESGRVTAADVERVRRSLHAQRRAAILQRYLSMDLDGDGNLSREELDIRTIGQRTDYRVRLEIALLDKPPGSTLTFGELSALAEAELAEPRSREDAGDVLMMFDLNADGAVDAAEIAEAIKPIAVEEKAAQEEQAAQMVALQAQREAQREARTACILPPASEAAHIVLLSGYEGSALSSVAVSGVDKGTSVATLIIEEGTQPLYIFATAYEPMVWKLSGNTARVERFVVQPGRNNALPGGAVAGLPAEKVSFTGRAACGGYTASSDDRQDTQLIRAITAALGRPAETLAQHYTLGQVSLPSGQRAETAKRAVGQSQASDLYRFHPEGLIRFELSDLVSNGTLLAYEVLPQEAGLEQLVASGALRRLEQGRYMIEKTFPYFPAGLSGAHSVTFILKDGVQRPAGSAGHSRVMLETSLADDAEGED